MRFSLWIIKDFFSDYKITYSIINYDRIITELRFQNMEETKLDHILYIRFEKNSVILENRTDYIHIAAVNNKDVLNQLFKKFTFYNDWSNSLKVNIHSIEREEELLQRSAKIFPNSILMLSDTSYYTHAFSYNNKSANIVNLIERVSAKRDLDLNSIIDIENNTLLNPKSRNAFFASLSDGSIKGSLRNIYADNELIGWLMISNMNDIVLQGDLHLQDELGDIIETWFALHLEKRELWRQSGLFIDLLEGAEIPDENIRVRLFLLGWALEHEKKMYLLKINKLNNKNEILVRKINQLSEGLHAFKYSEYIVVVVNINKTPLKYFEKELLKLLSAFNFQCVQSEVFGNMTLLKTQYKLTSNVINYAIPNTICSFSDLSVKYALSKVSDESMWIADPGLHILSTYDSNNNTELFKTLKIFLYENCNYTIASKLLNIHRSTLIYRINKITEICHFDLTNRDTRLKLIFSFMLLSTTTK